MKVLCISVLIVLAIAQNAGTQKRESHISFPYTQCTTTSGCNTSQGSITLDSNWRWTHSVSGYENCFTGTQWNPTFCPDPQTCTKNCAIDGVPPQDWRNPYGVEQVSGGAELKLVTHGQYGDNIGSRVYLLESENKYKMFNLVNKQFSFEVDVSQLECGINGALYFVEMEADGGAAKHPGNKAGAKYGTGYCDAQCPHDMKFIWGEANTKDWKDDKGHYGSCCAQLDIWEANKWANAYTAHPCSVPGYYRCQGNECGDGSARQNGICDKDGCDLNPFRNGNKNFYGPGSNYQVDTTKPFTVVTQFHTIDQSSTGELSEIKRFYIQNGKKIDTPSTKVDGLGPYNSISNSNCGNQKRIFGQPQTFANKGGLKGMGEALKRGMVLVMSIWDDHDAYMLWLDGEYPLNEDPSKPGVKRGPCSRQSGKPWDVEKQYPNAYTTFRNIKFGDIGSTYQLSEPSIQREE